MGAFPLAEREEYTETAEPFLLDLPFRSAGDLPCRIP
jgi:hypothetical protein